MNPGMHGIGGRSGVERPLFLCQKLEKYDKITMYADFYPLMVICFAVSWGGHVL